MSGDDRHQREVNLLLNKLLRLPRNKHPHQYRAAADLETFTRAPAFSLRSAVDLIEVAYRIHHLPSPYDLDGWEVCAIPGGGRKNQNKPVLKSDVRL